MREQLSRLSVILSERSESNFCGAPQKRAIGAGSKPNLPLARKTNKKPPSGREVSPQVTVGECVCQTRQSKHLLSPSAAGSPLDPPSRRGAT